MATMASAPSAPLEVDAAANHVLDTPAAGPAAVRGGVLQSVGWVAGTIVGVASGALLYRHLGVDDTGRYSLVIAMVAIVAGVSDLGLGAIGVRELSVRSGTARDGIARNLLGIRLVVGVLGVLIIILFSLVAGYGTTVTLGVVLAGLGLIIASSQSMLISSLVSELRLGWVAAFSFLRNALAAALIVALILVGAHLLAFLAIAIPVSIVLLISNIPVSYGTVPLLPAFELSRWKALVRDVLPYSIAVTAATLYAYVAVLLVSLLASSKTLGYFSVSMRVVQVLLLMPGLAIGSAFPIFARAARDDRARLAYALGRVFEVSLLAGVFVALCLAIGASLAIKVVGGAEFGPAASLLAIMGVGLGASFVGAVWANGLLSLHRYREILIVSLVALSLGGVLIAVLVVVDGAEGAAIATAAGEFVLAAVSGLVLWRVDPSLRPSWRIVPGVALAALLAALSTLVALPVLVSVSLAAAIYVAVVLVLGLVPKELREQISLRRRHARKQSG
jgi:O-antigen/teichoic acid export membrane protein